MQAEARAKQKVHIANAMLVVAKDVVVVAAPSAESEQKDVARRGGTRVVQPDFLRVSVSVWPRRSGARLFRARRLRVLGRPHRGVWPFASWNLSCRSLNCAYIGPAR